MHHSVKVGLSFGLTSGVITTLGLMVGLESGTSSRLAVIGGVLTIAIADAASDAMGIHISEESENQHTPKEIWMATVTTFLAKALFASIFIVPILLLPLTRAITFNVILGLLIMVVSSYRLAIEQKERPWKIIGEHTLLMAAVIVVTHFLGKWVAATFG